MVEVVLGMHGPCADDYLEEYVHHKTKIGDLPSLPDVKMAEVLNILSNTKKVTSSNGDVVEIDVEAMDNETGWELDRFLADLKETLNNMMKRQPETTPPLSFPSDAGNKSLSVAGEAPESMVAKKSKKGDHDENKEGK